MEKQNLAIFISESPEFDEYQGTEYMTWCVYVAMDMDDDVKYTRHFNFDSAWDHAEAIHRKHPEYEFVGLS